MRDKVIEKIIQKGEPANYWQATEEELKLAAAEKLVEEATELRDAIRDSQGKERVIAEAADVQDAFDKCRTVLRLDIEDIMHQQVRKHREWGSFEGGWMLEVA